MPITVHDSSGKPANNELRTVIVRLPPDMDAALRSFATENDSNLSQVIRRALKNYIPVKHWPKS